MCVKWAQFFSEEARKKAKTEWANTKYLGKQVFSVPSKQHHQEEANFEEELTVFISTLKPQIDYYV